jgi:hypothetical protein
VLACRHLHRTSINTSTRLRNPRKTRRMGGQQRAVSGDSLKSPRGIGKGHAQEGDWRMRLWALPPASRRRDNASMRAIDRPRPSPRAARASARERTMEKGQACASACGRMSCHGKPVVGASAPAADF